MEKHSFLPSNLEGSVTKLDCIDLTSSLKSRLAREIAAVR